MRLPEFFQSIPALRMYDPLAERQKFGRLRQSRVRRMLLDHWDDPELWRIEHRGIQS